MRNYQTITSKSMKIVEADKRMLRRGKYTLLFLLLLGALLPKNWQQILGVLGAPIAFIADFVPSIRKLSAISPISELVRGFFGLAVLLFPLFFCILMRGDPLVCRVQARLNEVGAFKLISIGLLVGTPVFLGLLYFCFFLPVDVRLGMTPTRGQMLLTLMVSYRFWIAILGSLLIIGLQIYLLAIVVFLSGPLIHFLRKSIMPTEEITAQQLIKTTSQSG